MEEILDQVYEQFVARREGSTKQRKRAKKRHSEDGLLEVLLMCVLVQIHTLHPNPSAFCLLNQQSLLGFHFVLFNFGFWLVIFMTHFSMASGCF